MEHQPWEGDEDRRFKGEFYTPKIWVDECHKYLDSALGQDWRETCIVWDPAAGAGALTRDYIFNNLLISTIRQEDVDYMVTQNVNPGSEKFVYDFLNPGEEDILGRRDSNCLPGVVEEKLREAAKAGKRLVFLMNPPYGTAGSAGANGKSKKGIARTKVNEKMKRAGWGPSSQQLYMQFMYQCHRIAEEFGFKSNVIATLCPRLYLSGEGSTIFRKKFYQNYNFLKGFLFPATEFDGIKAPWAVSFGVFESPGSTIQTEFDLLERKDGVIRKIGVKIPHDPGLDRASLWLKSRHGIKNLSPGTPIFSSGLNLSDPEQPRKIKNPLKEPFLARHVIWCNDVDHGVKRCYIVSGESRRTSAPVVTPSSFSDITVTFAARKLVDRTWVNDKDDIFAPLITLPGYDSWARECMIYTLFHPKNQCSSLRNITFNNKKWNIFNHFFFLTQEECLEAYKDHELLYKDCVDNPSQYLNLPDEIAYDPYFATLELDVPSMHPIVSNFYYQLKGLFYRSLEFREDFAKENPRFQLNAWDAGCYQLRFLWRECLPEDYKDLLKSYRSLTEYLRPGIYDFGFLKK